MSITFRSLFNQIQRPGKMNRGERGKSTLKEGPLVGGGSHGGNRGREGTQSIRTFDS